MKALLNGMKAVLAALILMHIPAHASDKKPAAGNDTSKPAAPPGVFITVTVPLFSPLFSGTPVASVEDEPVTLGQLTRALARVHEETVEAAPAGKKDYGDMLKRLITVRLVVKEAKNIGFDELPEVKNAMDAFSKRTLRQLLMDRYVKDITATDADVEELYRESVREYEIKTLLFEKKDVAQKARAEIKTDGDFDRVAKKFIESNKAKGDKEGKYLKAGRIKPAILKSLISLKAGAVTPVVPVESGFTITKLEDIRFPDDPKAKEQARLNAPARKQTIALNEYKKSLMKKYVRVNLRLFKSLDFESSAPGLESLSKDGRVVAEVKGDKPVTVAELTEVIKEKFYHGVEEAIKSKQVNREKAGALEEILHKRLFTSEALRKGIDKTEEYGDAVREYEDSLLFGLFVQKVIVPDIKIKDGELKAYYEEHKSEYMAPVRVTLDSLVFQTRKDAEDALGKLRKGADFEWMRTNAEGLADRKADALSELEDRSVALPELPEAFRKTLAGVRSGEFRLAEGPDGRFYVLSVRDVIPSQAMPFETVRPEIRKIVFAGKVKEAIDDWDGKLKKVYTVRFYISGREE